MARKIILKENGLAGSGNSPSGYKYLGDSAGDISEKVGATVSAIGGTGYTETVVKGFFVAQVDGTIVTQVLFNNSGINNSEFTLSGDNGNYGTLSPITGLTNSNCIINKIASWDVGDYTKTEKFGNNSTVQYTILPYMYNGFISLIVLNNSQIGTALNTVIGDGGRYYFEIEIFN